MLLRSTISKREHIPRCDRLYLQQGTVTQFHMESAEAMQSTVEKTKPVARLPDSVARTALKGEAK